MSFRIPDEPRWGHWEFKKEAVDHVCFKHMVTDDELVFAKHGPLTPTYNGMAPEHYEVTLIHTPNTPGMIVHVSLGRVRELHKFFRALELANGFENAITAIKAYRADNQE